MADDIAAVPAAGTDEQRLHELGYAQELRRRMSGFSNFAVSFTIISILSGCLTLYGYGMNTGGPAIIVWGWPIVGIMTLMVGLSMAEVCSSFPTAGGLYYWAAKLAPKNGPAWSWFTGWFNFLGQVAITAGIDFGCAFFINALLNLEWGVSTAHWVTILIFAGVLFLHGVMNQFGIRLVALLNNVSVWWHILGVLIIVAVLAFVPSKHASTTYVFTNIVNNTGWHSTFYVLLLGLLLAQYTFTGYDASAHMTEETHSASRSGPRGIVMSIVVSLIAGWVLLIGITFAIQETHYSLYTGALVPPAQIFVTAIGATGAKLLLLVIIGAQLFCGMSSVTANSRMIYAFSRDGALPGSNLWHQVNKRTRTPTNAIWLAAGGALILGLPYLWNSAAYAAVTSIAVIGLYIAYVMPTYLRLRQGENFKRGPWHLGRWSYLVGTIAVIWVVFITILFMLPTASPIGWGNFNYTVDGRARGDRLRRHLLAGLGEELVHRAQGPGLAGGTGRDRAGAFHLMPADQGARPRRGLLTLEQLRVAIGEGEIDTVVLAFTDMQGRLQGKRLSAEFFLDEVAEHYSEGCNYLLAVDVDMNTVDGYAMSSWDRGYGDFVMAPDMATLRRLPWHEGTRPGDRRPDLAGRRAGAGLAAADPGGADGEAGRTRLGGTGRDRARVRRLPGLLRAGRGQGLPRSGPGQPVQRGLLDPGHLPDRAAAAPDQEPDGRGRPVRGVGQGRVQPRPARDRVPLRRGGDHLRQPLDLQDRREGDRGPGREQHHVHGQAERPRGQLLPHPPVLARGGRDSGAGRGRAVRPVQARRALPGRPARGACASWPCATRRTSTPTSATSRAASPPPRSAGGRTTAPARCGWSGTGPRCGWRTGCPAAT